MSEQARFWRHPAVPEVDLLAARYVTHRFARHAHEEYAIGVILSGVEEFGYLDTTYRAGPGQLILVNPDHQHTGHAGAPGGWSYRMLYPTVEALTGGEPPGGVQPYFPEPVVDDPALAALARQAHLAAELGDGLAASTLVRRFFGGLLTRHATPRPALEVADGPHAVRQALELLAERLVDPPTLEELAREVRSRPFPLLRAFKAATGLPPHAYLTTLRVRQARRLLKSGLPAAEVAAAVGFTDQAHLTRHFKRIVGVPPAAYQRAAGSYKTTGRHGA
ncbi:AraC family transcriptional regulator [Thermoactinospora rubra]|uniref:AraC family transcriptional regulator n=1 Tax=Thermoactinospora rubra TaxID=1088767 RepID=UPI000A114D7C|nr:AraC family transcriptional regulator [Thermoactinospora rubra]